MISANNKISVIVEDQLPGFIREDHDNFVQFVKSYYEFLELTNPPVDMPLRFVNPSETTYTSTNKYGPTDQASRLLNPDKNPHVVRYFEKRMSQELEKEEKDKLLSYKHYARMRETSEKKGQMTAAITAQYRRDQMAGHFVDRKEISHIGLESMNREQLEKRLEELESKIGEAKNIIDVTPIEVNKN